MDAILNFDWSILHFIRDNLHSPFMDVLMPLITLLGEAGIFWIVTSLVLIVIKKTRKTGCMMACAVLLGFLVGNMLVKPLVARPRPYTLEPDVVLLVSGLSDYSFPSGHTLVCFEGAVVLLLRDKRFGIPALVLAFLVAFSRLYLYVHFPTDVLAGMLLGTLFAFIAVYAVNRLYPAAEQRLLRAHGASHKAKH